MKTKLNTRNLLATVVLGLLLLGAATACTEENVQPSTDIGNKATATFPIRD